MPHWNDPSKWLKVQQAVWVFDAWKFLTFNVHLHPELENKWVAEGRDVRKLIMAELRRELSRLVRPKPEFFFVVEGWSVRDRAPTRLHIHGGVAVLGPIEEPMIEAAVERACGLDELPVQGRTEGGPATGRSPPCYVAVSRGRRA